MGMACLCYTSKVLVSSSGALTLHSHAIGKRIHALRSCA